MKKKTYMTPALYVDEFGCATLFATSFAKYNDGGRAQLTKENNGDWSDIWSAPAADAGVNP
jgi:hypothetical protein